MAYALQERMPQIMETRLLMIVMVPLAPDELRMGCSGMDAARTELLPKSTHWRLTLPKRHGIMNTQWSRGVKDANGSVCFF